MRRSWRRTAGAARVICGAVAYELRPRRPAPTPPATPRRVTTRLDRPWRRARSARSTTCRCSGPCPSPSPRDDLTAIGGFDEDYVGYGAEDTDFGQRLARSGGRLLFVGGAEAVHQYHPTASPPVQHVADIVANANVFAGKWGWWPMLTWLEQFRDLDLVRQGPDGRWEALGGSAGPRPSPRRVRGWL